VTVERAGDIPCRLDLAFKLAADPAHGLKLLSHRLELPADLPG
jgi:hypothetical protein